MIRTQSCDSHRAGSHSIFLFLCDTGITVLLVISVGRRFSRGPETHGNTWSATKGYLGDRRQTGPELHHSSVKTQNEQRRDYKVSDRQSAMWSWNYCYYFRSIMSMDARDQFHVDMVEQMLKFTPSPEERALLDEHAEEMEHLARADRFLFELSK